MDILTKYCSKCALNKDVSLFSKNRAQRDGLHSQCKECNAAYYKANKEKISPKRIARYYTQQEIAQQYSRDWYRDNRDKALESCKNWASRNRDKIHSYAKKSRQKYPELKNANTQAYRAKKRGAMPSWLTEWDKFVISEYYYKAKRLEELTGMKWHVDHIHPLRGKTLSGLHVPWNLQLLPASENVAKGNRL